MSQSQLNSTIIQKSVQGIQGANKQKDTSKIERIAVCYHCAATEDLLKFRRADNTVLSICQTEARQRGMA